MFVEIIKSGKYLADRKLNPDCLILVECQMDMLHLGICNAYHDALEVGYCRIREEAHDHSA